MQYDVELLKKKVGEVFDEIVAIRRDLHQHPELSEEEVRTSALIAAKLDEYGIAHWDNVAGHGVVAYIPGKDKETAFGLRGDIDALPITEMTDCPFKSENVGVMHACGHDIHTAILLGAAKVLNTMKDELPVGVKFFFQPSEETIGGANQMVQAGFMEEPKVTKMAGLHIMPNFEVGTIEVMPGPMNAATGNINVTVKGKSAHGAYPHRGLDPLIPACSMVMSIQSIVARSLDPFDSGLITIGQFHSGTKDNIIPSETKFSGTIRALKTELVHEIAERAKRICEETAAAYGATAEVELSYGYPALFNNDDMAEILKKAAAKLIGEENVIYHRRPSLGADDFAFFSNACDAVYYNLGTHRKGDNDPALLHSEWLDPDEECIRTGILTEVGMMLELM